MSPSLKSKWSSSRALPWASGRKWASICKIRSNCTDLSCASFSNSTPRRKLCNLYQFQHKDTQGPRKKNEKLGEGSDLGFARNGSCVLPVALVSCSPLAKSFRADSSSGSSNPVSAEPAQAESAPLGIHESRGLQLSVWDYYTCFRGK